MPMPREYTPQRRWMMTATMWVIFVGILGLAVLWVRFGDHPPPPPPQFILE